MHQQFTANALERLTAMLQQLAILVSQSQGAKKKVPSAKCILPHFLSQRVRGHGQSSHPCCSILAPTGQGYTLNYPLFTGNMYTSYCPAPTLKIQLFN